ncbi:MAG: 16S rRNA (cytosine(967)-C(5))-methyltransferase RsmB [Verrucomicrobia bacterium]|nr:16S rRNA (cytosine(967)-C(5))-methyltransferase RsmB [Verrucomicrobiota bacterium]
MSARKPREIAAHVLRHREAGADYVKNLLDRALAGAALAPADRALTQELIYGVVRWQSTLEWLIARKTAGRPQKPGLQVLLRLGLYQLFWLDRVPDHAALNETVALARRLGFPNQAGFVNAVLRGYTRERAETERALAELRTSQPALGFSHPEWLCARWEKRWGGEKLGRLLEWNNTPPKTYARVNTLRTDAARLAAQWASEGVKFAARSWDWTGLDLVFELESHPSLADLPSFKQGLFYVQDPSTLLAVRELDPQPGECVLDLCAAPGGKTTFIAQLMQDRGRVVALDVSADKLRLVAENCRRLGITCVEPARTGGDLKSEISNLKFDKVLVDAPCSNTGVMRRRVDLRWRIRPEEIQRLSEGQNDLLCQAAQRTKTGGTLVYSTCSLEPEENSEAVKDFLGEHPEFKLASERELLPFADAVDGAYVAKLVRGRD